MAIAPQSCDVYFPEVGNKWNHVTPPLAIDFQPAINHALGNESLLGRLWRWHINWCPGWKKHMRSLPEEERKETVEQYGLNATKYQ